MGKTDLRFIAVLYYFKTDGSARPLLLVCNKIKPAVGYQPYYFFVRHQRRQSLCRHMDVAKTDGEFILQILRITRQIC